MTTPALADVADLEAWLGAEVPAERGPQVEALLDGASLLVRDYVDLDWLDDDGDLDPTAAGYATARTVTVQAAARVYRNPAGVIHETAGPFSSRRAEAEAQGLYLTATERSMLDRIEGKAKRALWTQATTREDIETGTVFVAEEGGTDRIPLIAPEPY